MKKFLFAFLILFVVFSGCTGSAIKSSQPVSSNFCSSSSDCELVFVGSGVCPACNQGSDDWVCMKKEDAAISGLFAFVSKITGFFSISLNPVDCSCPAQEFEYTCSCENGECTKVISGKNPFYCNQVSDCYEKNLEHKDCAGGFVCEKNSCVWECSVIQPQAQSISGTAINEEKEIVLPFDCEKDEECFRAYLASCDLAKYNKVSVRFFSGVRNSFSIQQEILGRNTKGLCTVLQISVNKPSNSVFSSECSYDGLKLLDCRVVSGG